MSGVGLRTALSTDPESAALNTKAHAQEHCALDRASLDVLGSAVGRQVLIQRTVKRLALYTVAERIDVAGRAAHVGTVGLTRLGETASEPPATLRATLEPDFTGGDAPARLTEQLLGRAATGLAILAPHGGQIEPGTDLQARLVFDTLAKAGRPVRAWIARGLNPAGAHRCWHVTATEISPRSFPRLGSLFGLASRGVFAHAVAFHGQNDTAAVVVGGGLPRDPAHTKLKVRLQGLVRDALALVMDDPPAVVVRRSGPLAGAERANLVNRITAAGNGLQLEQPAGVRTVKEQRDAIARAVAAFYADLV